MVGWRWLRVLVFFVCANGCDYTFQERDWSQVTIEVREEFGATPKVSFWLSDQNGAIFSDGHALNAGQTSSYFAPADAMITFYSDADDADDPVRYFTIAGLKPGDHIVVPARFRLETTDADTTEAYGGRFYKSEDLCEPLDPNACSGISENHSCFEEGVWTADGLAHHCVGEAYEIEFSVRCDWDEARNGSEVPIDWGNAQTRDDRCASEEFPLAIAYDGNQALAYGFNEACGQSARHEAVHSGIEGLPVLWHYKDNDPCGIITRKLPSFGESKRPPKVHYLKAPPSTESHALTYRHRLRTVERADGEHAVTLGALAVERFGGIELEWQDPSAKRLNRAIAMLEDIEEESDWDDFVDGLQESLLPPIEMTTTLSKSEPYDPTTDEPIAFVAEEADGVDAMVAQLCLDDGCSAWNNGSAHRTNWIVLLPPDLRTFAVPVVPTQIEPDGVAVTDARLSRVDFERIPGAPSSEVVGWPDVRTHPPALLFDKPADFGAIRFSHSSPPAD
jgi:hypothetical protein